MRRDEELERMARIAVECGLELHRELGPGLLESVYEILMFESLRRQGLTVERQTPVRIEFKGIVIDNAFRTDLIVEG
jgi:GxxExxY protein